MPRPARGGQRVSGHVSIVKLLIIVLKLRERAVAVAPACCAGIGAAIPAAGERDRCRTAQQPEAPSMAGNLRRSALFALPFQVGSVALALLLGMLGVETDLALTLMPSRRTGCRCSSNSSSARHCPPCCS